MSAFVRDQVLTGNRWPDGCRGYFSAYHILHAQILMLPVDALHTHLFVHVFGKASAMRSPRACTMIAE